MKQDTCYLRNMIGIMGAMPEEIDSLVGQMQRVQQHNAGMRTYYSGTLFGREAVVVFSRWGKVAAATTALHLIHQYQVKQLLFTGVAGAVSPLLSIGDVVVGHRLYQHDMDARPLMQRFEIPLLGKTYFETNQIQREQAFERVKNLLSIEQLQASLNMETLNQYGITAPTVRVGDIASGDKFFSLPQHKTELLEHLPGVLCVEMEGAAVAQVCHEYGLPFNIIRIISDVADDNSHIDFPAFIAQVAGPYSAAIVRQLFS
ncbi:5'-methylthioadenosine/adenosylhomocysteine nucleosidase [Oscillatoria amoena NRMC-F 0135]|nr:5'-methylthioadenosine/adenosylhomocysteine nucleosidase [Oscillatoria amoena NRMC-F 0135]